MHLMEYEKKIKQSIVKALKEAFDFEVDEKAITVENPKDFTNGIFSTNIALVLTKQLKRNPIQIAEEIKEKLESKEIAKGSKIEVAKPGFINFYMDINFFEELLKSAENTNFKFSDVDTDKYLVEYISANPTGDLHLGHARNAVYGSSLINIMKKYGIDVTSEYYLNDAGNQMKNLGLSVKYFYMQKINVDMEFPEDGYRGQDIQNIAAQMYSDVADTKKDADLEFFIEYSYKINLENIKELLNTLNINFDNWTSERSLYESGKVKNSLEVLKGRGELFEEEGALWLQTTKYGDEKDRVIRKNDGAYTYFTADIAYHIDKYNRGYQHLIDIWGADHHGYIPRVKAAIEALGKDPKKFEIPIIQMVSVLENNVAVKMSKRAGTSVTINDLLKDIEVDSLRYLFVMRSIDTQLDFDIEVAKKKDMENPIYYIQYACARINTVLEDFKEKQQTPIKYNAQFSELEKEIILKLGQYGKIIVESTHKRAPHVVSNYLYELASLFHKYYNQEKVFTDSLENVAQKVDMYEKIYIVLEDALKLLAIKAKKEM